MPLDVTPGVERKYRPLGFMSCLRKLHEDMNKLLLDGDHSDLKIICRGIEFNVHRAVLLPRCKFFRSCFDSGFKEGEDGIVVLDDDDPVALRMILREIYTYDPGNIRECFNEDKITNFSTLIEICKLAHKSDLSNLALQCLQFIRSEEGLDLLKCRSGAAFKADLLAGLSTTKGLNGIGEGSRHYAELRKEIIKILLDAKDFSAMSEDEEEILKGDPELTIELLKYAAARQHSEELATEFCTARVAT